MTLCTPSGIAGCSNRFIFATLYGVLNLQTFDCACKSMSRYNMGQLLDHRVWIQGQHPPFHTRVFTVNPFYLYQYNIYAFSTPEQGFREACLPFF